MPWNDQLREALLGNLDVFRANYANRRTQAINPANENGDQLDNAALNRLRCAVKRITQLVPNAVCHDSPGYNETPVPHVVISRPVGQDMGGKLDGDTRIALYVVNGHLEIGLRARQGRVQDIGNRYLATEPPDEWQSLCNGRHNMPNYITRPIGNIDGDENLPDERDGAWANTLLEGGAHLANFLAAENADENIFSRS